jgi:hypothetical protein
MIISNFFTVLPEYLLFVFFCLPVFTYLIVRQDIRRSAVFSITLTVSLFGYAALYFLMRMAISDRNVIRWWMIMIPPIAELALLFSARKAGPFEAVKRFIFDLNRSSVWTFVGMLFLYGLIVAPYLLRNGIDADGNLRLYDLFATEGMWHANMIAGIRENIIPQTLHYNATGFYSYHFFPNLFMEMFAFLANTENYLVVFVYFFVPVTLVTLAVNIYAVALLLWNQWRIAVLSVFISFFCFDLSSLILWIRGIAIEHSWSFGSNSPSIISAWSTIVSQFQIFHNPSHLYSSALFFGLIVLTQNYAHNRSKWLFVFSCVGWAVIIKAKITAYVVAMGAMFIYGILKALYCKEKEWLSVFVVSLLLSLPFLFASVGQPKNSAEFSKWYFPANFAARSNFISQEAREEISQSGSPSRIKAGLMFTVAFAVYYAGLLNLRLIAGFRKISHEKIKRLITDPSPHTFTLLTIAIGMFFFIFVCNSLSKYDSLWFYLLVLFSINMYLAERVYVLFG